MQLCWKSKTVTLEAGALMGILNVTPDSFSDGGSFDEHRRAVEQGLRLWNEGAYIIDVGGESTRPGAARVPEGDELARVLPVVEALCSQGVRVSVDTTRAAVATACVLSGASMVNDVSGGLADPAMFREVACFNIPYVLMHWRSHSDRMSEHSEYDNVVTEVRQELLLQVRNAVLAGVREENIVLDPGLGFSKTSNHNWQLLRRLDDLKQLGFPILVGASRKRFLGELLADETGLDRDVTGRDNATSAISAIAAYQGAWGVRVHDVRSSVDAVRVATKLTFP